MRRPTDSFTNITSRHGEPVQGSFYGKHLGTDYAVGPNTVVKAPVAGKVATQGWSDSVGHYVEIDGDDGRRHRLLHLNVRQVQTGARVAEGQQVALSGSTGSSSTGPHVHWDARKAGTAFGAGFENYVDTEALVQAPNPGPGGAPVVNPGVVGRTVWLKGHVQKWRLYAENVKPVVGNEKAFLRPALFNNGPGGQKGLTYRILAVTQHAQCVVIQTQDFGRGVVYLDADAAIL